MNAPKFTGTLNTNEIYSALTNLKILFQIFRPHKVLKDEIVRKINKSTGMFGDTGIIHGLDIQGTYDFTKDLEASKLLQVNRNKTSVVESYTINQWRQADVTNDTYISKRAFLDENTFAVFNNYLASTLPMAFDAYENGYVKSRVGAQTGETGTVTVEVELPARTDEASSRQRAALIKNAVLDLAIKMKDNSRDFNRYKHYASYNIDDFEMIMSSKYKNEINALSYYSMFDKSEVKFNTDSVWTPKWFGEAKVATTVPVGSTLMDEINSDGSSNLPLTDAQVTAGVVRMFPGDIVNTEITSTVDVNFLTPNTNVIAILFNPDYAAYLTGFQQSESFYNKRSSTTNHYLRKGFSNVLFSGLSPFIVVTEKTV